MRNLKKLAALLMAAALMLSLSVTAFAAVEGTGFSDVDADAWYAEAVVYCRERGLMNGTSGTAFEPESSLTRAMLVTVLYRSAGSPAVTGTDDFRDTESGAWYSDAILWASRQNLVNGYGNGLFGTNDPITQEQLNLIFQRYTNKQVTENIPGFDGSSRHATRAQAAAALMNLTRDTQTTPDASNETKVLVAYFSATNTTKSLAEYIADGLDADIYEIVPETPYTSADLNYSNSSSRATVEQNDSSARPTISGSVANMEQYDIVFIGYPIWWGQAPRIVSTFLESYDFNGKTIVPFCTSGSSGIGSSASNLHSLTNGANWLDGRRFSGGTSRNTMIEWVNGLGLDITAK